METKRATLNRIELVSHPVRMRLMLTLANRVLTTQQVAELLPDVAQTTLCRHINLLLDGGILMVVRESKIRGTVERELTLVKGAGRIDMETAMTLSPEQQERLFTTFVALLLADFQRAQAQPVARTPPAIYTQQRLYVTPEELQALSEQFETLLAAYKDPARATTAIHPWLFTGIVIPDTDAPAIDEEKPI